MKKLCKFLFKTKIVKKTSKYALHENGWFTFPSNKNQQGFLEVIKEIRKKNRLGLDDFEAYQLYSTLKNLRKVPGSVAEVGVFEGGSAKILDKVRGNKKMFLFDTFSGLPVVQNIDSKVFYTGQFLSEFESIKKNFKNEKDIFIFKGLFPKETSQTVFDKKFSFVHIDVDLYKGTFESLDFFYSRMVKGGVIMIHDYSIASGVKQATDNFFRDKPEIILEPSYSQALVVKI